MQAAAVIVAAGRSTRLKGGRPKQFLDIAGKPMLAWTLGQFERARLIERVVLVVAEEEMMTTSDEIVDRYKFAKVTKIVSGGESRRESVLNGLEALSGSTQLVAIHDGARPAVTPADIDRVVEVAFMRQAAILAQPIVETVKQLRNGEIVSTIPRATLMAAQTPQVFNYELILDAHRRHHEDEDVTDDASLIERDGIPVHFVIPSNRNPKVTTIDDIQYVTALLGRHG